jgi:DNA-binding NarL/FixJ family response regulator
MIRVLLADDQALVRSGFRVILSSAPDIEVVGEAEDGQDAVEQAQRLVPDVICMDIEMPRLSGIDATHEILNQHPADRHPEEGRAECGHLPSPAVLMLTTFSHEPYVFAALAAGAKGFLLKTARAEQLLEGVRALASGKALLDTEVTRAVLEHTLEDREVSNEPDGEATSAARSTRPKRTRSEAMDLSGLTPREAEVLDLIAQGLTNAELAQTLFVGEATVKTHVSNIMQKLGARDRVQLVVWAYTQGTEVW